MRDVTAVQRAAGWLLAGAAGTSSWSGTRLLGQQPVDVLLAAALGLVVLAALGGYKFRPVPPWIWLPALVVAAIAVLRTIAPVSPSYLSLRYRLPGDSVNIASDLSVGGRWLVALLVLPVVVVQVARSQPRLLRRMSTSWMWGAAISAGVAIGAYVGVPVADALSTFGAGGSSASRQAGLTAHPNILAIACAMALPVALIAVRSRRWSQLSVIGLLLGGVTVSGSRAGQLAAAVVLVCATASARRRGQKRLAAVLLLAGVVIVARAVVSGSQQSEATLFRFGTRGADLSDVGRDQLRSQALLDFAAQPFLGIGLDALNASHLIFLSVLAAGGAALLVAVLAYFGGALLSRTDGSDPNLITAMRISLLALIVFDLAQNQLTDRFVYVPVAVIAAASAARRGAAETHGVPALARGGAS